MIENHSECPPVSPPDYTLDESIRWQEGYNRQYAWLVGKSRAEAEHALATRLATCEDSPFNEGGHAATRYYIGILPATATP